MEQFVESLYSRLDVNRRLMLQVMMDNAINEMHNNGIIAGLTGEAAARVHHADPKVRVTEKTLLAKSVGKQYISKAEPNMVNGKMCYQTTVIYDRRFINAICICLQGGIEGLYLSGMHHITEGTFDYNIVVENSSGESIEPLMDLVGLLDMFYEEYNIRIVPKGSAASAKPAAPAPKPVEKKEAKPGFFARLFGKKERETAKQAPQAAPRPAEPTPAPKPAAPSVKMPHPMVMLSQYAALYMKNRQEAYRDKYVEILLEEGLTEREALALFEFDCGVVKQHRKIYLLIQSFVKEWFFNLQQPFLTDYPKEKPDLIQERFFTISELAKLIDEAEWHYWNSHEREMPEVVWSEICAYRLKGDGFDFAIAYYEMISRVTGVSMDKLAAVNNHEGRHLSRYKW